MKWSPFIPIEPTPKQHLFLWVRDKDGNPDEVLYGGAAGGGKSIAGLAAAAQWVDEPSYSGLLLRRTYQDLSKAGALLNVAKKWWPASSGVHFDGDRFAFVFPSGAEINFGYIRNDKDLEQYDSAKYQYIYIDELTQFTLHQYRYMFSRLRRDAGSPVPLRMRGGTNPGKGGHLWVKERWRLGAENAGIQPGPNRFFIPAALGDNPHLDRHSYEMSLSHLDPVMRARLLDGNWDVMVQGDKFRREWFLPLDPRDESEGPHRIERSVRYWDLAATEKKTTAHDPDYTVGLRLSVTVGGEFIVDDIVRGQWSSNRVDRELVKAAEKDGRSVPIWIEQEPGSSGKRAIVYFKKLLTGWECRGDKVSGSKELRANPVSSLAEDGDKFRIRRAAWNADFLDELEVFPSPDAHDDQVDALSGAFDKLTTGQGWGFF